MNVSFVPDVMSLLGAKVKDIPSEYCVYVCAALAEYEDLKLQYEKDIKKDYEAWAKTRIEDFPQLPPIHVNQITLSENN
jgi:hypothetical protein